MFKLPLHHSARLLVVLWHVIQTIHANSFFPFVRFFLLFFSLSFNKNGTIIYILFHN